MGFRDRPGALVGAHVPVDVEHRGLFGAVLGVAAGHRGDPVAGPAGLGEQPDLAADRLDLRRPVQTQHPPQRGRVDPRRALGAGLAQQGAEHALAQHRIQRIEPVRQRAVGGVRILDQPGRRQRGQRQQQSRQRCPRAPGEHRRRGRDQPKPRQCPLGATVDRIRQHRHRPEHRRITGSHCGAILPSIHHQPRPRLGLGLGLGLGRSIRSRCGARFLGAGAVIGKYERVADAALRHPDAGADGAVGRSTLAQPADGSDGVGGEFRLAFGTFAFGEQPGHAGLGEPGLPAPHRGRCHRERLSDLELGGRLDPHQRHRREPARRGVVDVPGIGQIAVHEHPPARVVLDDRRGRADRTGALQRQRQGRLRGHHGHHPPPYGSPDIAISIIEHRGRGRAHDTPGNPQITAQNYRPGTGSMSGVEA